MMNIGCVSQERTTVAESTLPSPKADSLVARLHALTTTAARAALAKRAPGHLNCLAEVLLYTPVFTDTTFCFGCCINFFGEIPRIDSA
jgi:hypothetical protein